MMGTRGNGGAAGAEENELPRVTQPTQDELDATALALANQQEMTRLRQLETERVRLAAAATLLAQQQLALAQPGVPPVYQPVSFNGTLPGAPVHLPTAPLQQHLALLRLIMAYNLNDIFTSFSRTNTFFATTNHHLDQLTLTYYNTHSVTPIIIC